MCVYTRVSNECDKMPIKLVLLPIIKIDLIRSSGSISKTCFNVLKFCTLLMECIYVCCAVLTIDIIFSEMVSPVELCSEVIMCFL
jgi:hypothetical protein